MSQFLLAWLLLSIGACWVWYCLTPFVDSSEESQAMPVGHFTGDQGEVT